MSYYAIREGCILTVGYHGSSGVTKYKKIHDCSSKMEERIRGFLVALNLLRVPPEKGKHVFGTFCMEIGV